MATWRVLTWNLHGSADPNLDVISEVLLGYRPDVAALQEVQHHQTRAIARRTQWRAYWSRKHFPYTPLMWWRAEGLALLSPHALSAPVTGSLSPTTSTWSYRHRIAVAATADRGRDRLRVGNVHLESTHIDVRLAQAARATALIRSGSPTVVAGDLNATNDAELLREFGRLGVVDPGGDASNPSRTPLRRLDYILVPDGATVTANITPPGGAHWAQLSDHLPVVVEFTLQTT